jgi:PAS domain S-box-containing protein
MAKKPTYEELKQRVKELKKLEAEYKQAEEALRESEGKYRHLFEMESDAIFLIRNSDGQILEVNTAGVKLYGFSREELLKMKNTDMSAEPDETRKATLKRKKEIPTRYHKKKDGTVFPVEITGNHFNWRGEEVHIASIRDITKRKQDEEALRKSEERFRNVYKTAPLAFVIWDKNTHVTDWNKKAEEIFGWSKEEVVGHNFFDFLIPDKDRPQVEDVVNSLLKGDISSHSINENLTKEGKIITCEWNNSALHDDDGNIIGAISLGLDITDRKQAEEAVRESEIKFRSLFELSPQAVALTELKSGRLVDVNNKFCELTKYSKEEILGLNTTEVGFYLEADRNKFLNELQASGAVNGLEMDFMAKDGSILNSLMFARIIQIAGGPFILTIFYDLTEQKRLQAQLQQAQKMESVGLLAGGVAHDLNNVLSGIVSYPELLLLDLPEDSKLRKPIETMQESGHRAAAIVQDLLTVARGVATTKGPLNLNDLVSDYLNSPEFKKLEQFHPSVTIKVNLNSNLLNITGSRVHIRKVIMNLVSNASEAIEGSGNVIISTMNRYIDRPLKGYDDVTIGEYAVLAVSDDGSGISSGDLERIFDPFYTKKVLGRSGTGLGLAVVWNVVQDHEGYIDVKSDENGTIFELYFSITRDEISDKALSIPIKDYKGNGERILVVDDVESQQEISCKMLDTLGYKTQAVSSGEEAIEYLKENTVDLILLDMIMDPGINGRETYERIIKIHPKQKAIIVSGFAETDDVKETQKLGAGQYIKKPLTLEGIGIAVKDELKK